MLWRSKDKYSPNLKVETRTRCKTTMEKARGCTVLKIYNLSCGVVALQYPLYRTYYPIPVRTMYKRVFKMRSERFSVIFVACEAAELRSNRRISCARG